MATQTVSAATKPATLKTEERFPGDIPPDAIDDIVALRISAGAIRSSKAKDPSTREWVVTTEWNVIGGNA